MSEAILEVNVIIQSSPGEGRKGDRKMLLFIPRGDPLSTSGPHPSRSSVVSGETKEPTTERKMTKKKSTSVVSYNVETSIASLTVREKSESVQCREKCNKRQATRTFFDEKTENPQGQSITNFFVLYEISSCTKSDEDEKEY